MIDALIAHARRYGGEACAAQVKTLAATATPEQIRKALRAWVCPTITEALDPKVRAFTKETDNHE